MNINEEKIQKACTLLHSWFKDEANDYSEREDSDVEYFVGVMMYNSFSFSKAIATMKTMDIGIDFIQASGDTYMEALSLIRSIQSDNEEELLLLLQNHITSSLDKYANDSMSCYLLQRLQGHIQTLSNIYKGKIDVRKVDFEKESRYAR
ncbi:MAG: hypothetical protein U9R50_05275 [Campylobacterota bacterium]|nr:hypothetical protein [Campylobacterota bacterium]